MTSTVLTFAHICQITYTNGDKYGFTTHDRRLTIDGVTFSPIYAVNNLNKSEELNTAPNTQEIQLIWLPPNIQDAEVTTAIVDWRNLPANFDAIPDTQKQTGIVGEVKYNGAVYSVEVLSQASAYMRMNRSVKTAPICRFDFCDQNPSGTSQFVGCGLDINNNSQTTTVNNMKDDHEFMVNGVYSKLRWGWVKFLSGQNEGKIYSIYNSYPNSDGITTTVILNTYTEYPIAQNDQVLAVNGCAKTEDACKNTHNNFLNYGGHLAGGNYMPGDNFYIASPVQ